MVDGGLRAAIRAARPDDVDGIIKILDEIGWFDNLTGLPKNFVHGRVLENLQQCGADESHNVIVADDGQGHIIGYINVHWIPYLCFAGPVGLVTELFISGSTNRFKIGSALLDEVKKIAQRRRCPRLTLSNARDLLACEREFYEKYGFTERPGVANFVLKL